MRAEVVQFLRNGAKREREREKWRGRELTITAAGFVFTHHFVGSRGVWGGLGVRFVKKQNKRSMCIFTHWRGGESAYIMKGCPRRPNVVNAFDLGGRVGSVVLNKK